MLDGVLGRAAVRFHRLRPAEAWAELQAGALVVDLRPLDQRQRDGEVPGAVVVGRNLLEAQERVARRGPGAGEAAGAAL